MFGKRWEEALDILDAQIKLAVERGALEDWASAYDLVKVREIVVKMSHSIEFYADALGGLEDYNAELDEKILTASTSLGNVFRALTDYEISPDEDEDPEDGTENDWEEIYGCDDCGATDCSNRI